MFSFFSGLKKNSHCSFIH